MTPSNVCNNSYSHVRNIKEDIESSCWHVWHDSFIGAGHTVMTEINTRCRSHCHDWDQHPRCHEIPASSWIRQWKTARALRLQCALSRRRPMLRYVSRSMHQRCFLSRVCRSPWRCGFFACLASFRWCRLRLGGETCGLLPQPKTVRSQDYAYQVVVRCNSKQMLPLEANKLVNASGDEEPHLVVLISWHRTGR